MVSKLVRNLTESIKKIPSISKRNAESISFFLLEHRDILKELSTLLSSAVDINWCTQCRNLTSGQLCKICVQRANSNKICIVKSTRDLVKIEGTKSYDGKYHILGIQNLENDHLDLSKLMQRIKQEKIEEIILGIDPDTNGEMLSQGIVNALRGKVTKISKILIGIPFGSKIDVIDQFSLGNSIANRVEV